MCRSCHVQDRFLKHDGFAVVRMVEGSDQMFPVYEPSTRRPRRFVSMKLAELEANRLAQIDKILPDSSGSLAPLNYIYKAVPIRVAAH